MSGREPIGAPGRRGSPEATTAGLAPIGIIGIDCAVASENVGLALARYTAGKVRVTDVSAGRRGASVAQQVAGWLVRYPVALLALDAPLGWPRALGRALASHCAGAPLLDEADALFRRDTDAFVRAKLGKRPLDVGADRIARTARAALELLRHVGQRTGTPVNLAWTPWIEGVRAIEVYPAATLVAHGFKTFSAKQMAVAENRCRRLDDLGSRLVLPKGKSPWQSSPHCLDALTCVLAAVDFLQNSTFPPSDTELARREGWIWVADPDKITKATKGEQA